MFTAGIIWEIQIMLEDNTKVKRLGNMTVRGVSYTCIA